MFFCAGLNNGHMLHSSKEGEYQSKESFSLNQEDRHLCARKKGKTKQAKNHKQNKKHRQNQMGMFLDIYI